MGRSLVNSAWLAACRRKPGQESLPFTGTASEQASPGPDSWGRPAGDPGRWGAAAKPRVRGPRNSVCSTTRSLGFTRESPETV